MNSREIVTRAVEFTNPERIPIAFPGFRDYPGYGNPDIVRLGYAPPPIGLSEDETLTEYEDEWGCVWKRLDRTTMGHTVKHPLSDWAKLDTYQLPDPLAKDRFTGAKKEFSKLKHKYVVGGVEITLFARMMRLRGFDNLLVDLYSNREKLEILADRVLDFQIQIVRLWANVGVNGVNLTDDWGTENSLMISPRMWREIFKPRYKRLFDAAHQEGMHAFFHSDGQIYEIVPDLIECGLDVLELAQPHVLGIERVSKDFGGRICFYGAVDKQTTLVSGTRQEIREEARKLVELLGCFQGGFIAMGRSWDYYPLNISQRNFRIMCEAFEEFGRLKSYK